MKVEIEDEFVLELTSNQIKVIKNDIFEEIFESDCKRRITYWLEIPCYKFASAHNKEMIQNLKSKNIPAISINKIKAAVTYLEHFPTKHPITDIKEMSYKVNGEEFILSKDMRIIWRRLLEHQFDALSYEEIIKKEKDVLKLRASYILTHKYEKCLERLKMEWIPKLEASGITEIPVNEEEFCALIFSQPTYLSRSEREARDTVNGEDL